jgi:hypothetical protein
MVSGFWIGVANGIDGVCSADGLMVFKLMTEFVGYGIHDGNALLHDFGADAIARKDCNV